MKHYQRGHSLLELLLVLSVVAIFGSLASYSAMGWINSSRLSREASKLADYISVARQKAVADRKLWRVHFVYIPPSEIVHSYVLQSCAPDQAIPDKCDGDSNWFTESDPLGRYYLDPIVTETGVALAPQPPGSSVSNLIFDRRGFFTNADTVEIQVCQVTTTSVQQECRPGGRVRVIRVNRLSGSIEM